MAIRPEDPAHGTAFWPSSRRSRLGRAHASANAAMQPPTTLGGPHVAARTMASRQADAKYRD